MLSGLRFVIGAILAAAMLGVGSLGLYATVKLRHQANAGPIESSRNLMFGDRADWNPFYYSDSVRRFEQLTRQPGASEPAEASASAAASGAENVVRQSAAASTDDASSKERAADTLPDEPQRIIPAVEAEPSHMASIQLGVSPLSGEVDRRSEANGGRVGAFRRARLLPRTPPGSLRSRTSPFRGGINLVTSAIPVVTTAPTVSAPAAIDARPQETSTADEVTRDASPAVQGDEAHVIAAAAIAVESRGTDPAVTSAPSWDEEPLLIAEDEPSAVMNRTAGTPAR